MKDSRFDNAKVKQFVELKKSGDNGQWVFRFKRNSGNVGKEVFRQALVKARQRGWPVLIPGKYIDELFNSKLISHFETHEQVVDVIKFLIHFQKAENYMTKFIWHS